jgi:hypothetical protein
MWDLASLGVVVDRLPVDAEEDRDLLGVQDFVVTARRRAATLAA